MRPLPLPTKHANTARTQGCMYVIRAVPTEWVYTSSLLLDVFVSFAPLLFHRFLYF